MIFLQYLELCNPLICIKTWKLVAFWEKSEFMWLFVGGVARKFSKNLHISINFFVEYDSVRIYVMIIACLVVLGLVFFLVALFHNYTSVQHERVSNTNGIRLVASGI